MTKETGLSLLRSILTLAGTYLVGHNLFGVQVDQSVFQIILGSVVALGSTIWGIVDKSLGSEQLISAIKSIVLGVGGIFVAAGKITGSTLDAISGLLLALAPIILGQAQKKTIQQVGAGTAVPQIKPGTEPANVETVFTGKLVKQSPPIADQRAKQ